MFSEAINVVEVQLLAQFEVLDQLSHVDLPPEYIPHHYSLKQLHDAFTGATDHRKNLINTIVLERCLQFSDRIVEDSKDATSIQHILTWLSKGIRVGEEFAIQDELADGDRNVRRAVALKNLRQNLWPCLCVIRALHSHKAYSARDTAPSVLLSLLGLTDPDDSWTTESGCQFAVDLLNHYMLETSRNFLIIDTILVGFIRPVFSQSQPASVTTQGRKAINVATRSLNHVGDFDLSKKPWKFKEVSAVTVFKWAVAQADESMISHNWHLFIPPVLALLDDVSTNVRFRGLRIFNDLLNKTSPRILKQTGLGDVFEDAVMPTLLFLPNLTPVNESLRLLRASYTVLFLLADVRFPKNEDSLQRSKFLDRIMRRGILQGFLLSRDNIEIMTCLMEEMTLLIFKMGINAAKHLKDIIPLVSSILTDPFAPSEPDTLITGIRSAKTTVLSCWPRMVEGTYHLELIRAFCICWNNVTEAESSPKIDQAQKFPTIKRELSEVVTILCRSVEGAIGVEAELKTLVAVDPSLRGLFDYELDQS